MDLMNILIQKERRLWQLVIPRLALGFTKSRIILTCRSGEFNYALENSSTYEIAPLSKEQIQEFASRWIGNKQKVARFLQALYHSPFADTAIKPLSLAHLCAVFERVGDIPDKPKTVYRKIVTLLLEDWDQQRSVRRTSKYAKFEVDRKFEFLSNLAFLMTTEARLSVFNRAQLTRAYDQICSKFGLDASDCFGDS